MYNDEIYNTKTIQIGENRYCAYCGEVAEEKIEFDEYHKYTYYFCNCEGAKLEIEKQKIEDRLKEYEKMASKKLNKLKYEAELKLLKYKYGIE